MTKKERLNLNTEYVLTNLKVGFNVSTDFYDDEGRGYFTFGVTRDKVEYLFDLSRNNFSVISHKIRGEKGHFESMNLESELEIFIKEKLNESNEIIDQVGLALAE